MANGKTPGGDGLPAEFFKQFRGALIPRLLKVYEEALTEGELPETTREAMVIPLPKQGQEAGRVQSYRPLSMLTVDFKFLSKILAIRLGPKMEKLIHVDQNRFMPARNTSLNHRRLYRVLEDTDVQKYPRAMVASLDLEKAFDSLSWEFLS